MWFFSEDELMRYVMVGRVYIRKMKPGESTCTHTGDWCTGG